jgi:hypothetical protein
LVAAIALALAIHVVALWSFVKACPPDCVAALYVYTAGLLVATALGVGVAVLASPRQWDRSALPYLTAALVVVSFLAFAHGCRGGAWRSCDINPLVAIIGGGIVGANLAERARAARKA